MPLPHRVVLLLKGFVLILKFDYLLLQHIIILLTLRQLLPEFLYLSVALFDVALMLSNFG